MNVRSGREQIRVLAVPAQDLGDSSVSALAHFFLLTDRDLLQVTAVSFSQTTFTPNRELS